MAFVQIIEFKTSRFDEVLALMDEWMEATQGRRTPTSSLTCRDRDADATFVQIVEFPSYDEAMRNSELPETSEFAERMTALCDGPATFRNLEVERDDRF